MCFFTIALFIFYVLFLLVLGCFFTLTMHISNCTSVSGVHLVSIFHISFSFCLFACFPKESVVLFS